MQGSAEVKLHSVYFVTVVTFPSATASIQHWLQVKAIGDTLQTLRIFLDVIHLGNLRGAVAEEIGDLLGRETSDGAVLAPYAVD